MLRDIANVGWPLPCPHSSSLSFVNLVWCWLVEDRTTGPLSRGYVGYMDRPNLAFPRSEMKGLVHGYTPAWGPQVVH